MLDIRDSVAVITGGGRGIGRALAEYWVANGGKVALADLSEESLDEAKSFLENLGGEVVTLTCDVTNEADNAWLASVAVEAFGRINLVAPCAGIVRDGMVLETATRKGKVTGKMSLEQFQSVLNTNLTGVFLTVRECTEQMINHGCRGLICLFSSTAWLGAAGQFNYASSKAAVSVAPKVLTAEFFRLGLADRIRCVAIAPGYVDTPLVRRMSEKHIRRAIEQVPIGRLVDPYEIASLVGELYRNEALAADVFYIHGGLRLGSRG